MIKFIDLFSGIGGFRLAFESVGAICVFSAEIDKHACKTYEENFGENPFCDISNLNPSSLPHFDILCAGFPCQPFSLAGKRQGFQDTRGTLFFDIEHIIQIKQPKAFILENVKGLVNHNKGKTLKVILEILEKKLHYKVFYKVLNSKDFNIPQNRERIYIIGFKNHHITFHFPKKIEPTLNLSHIRDDSLEEGTSISELAKSHIITHLKNHKAYQKIKSNPLLLSYEIRKSRASFRFDNISPCLTAKMGTGGNNVPIFVNEMRKFTTRECLRIQGFPESYKIAPNTSQSYKQIGNSISVPLVTLLAEEIIKNLQKNLLKNHHS
jgi:DNA (cytosine-5)-methyltransferase 1